MPWWIVLSVITLSAIGVALVLWRREATSLQAIAFGARLHPGCAVVEGVLLLLLALLFFLVARSRF